MHEILLSEFRKYVSSQESMITLYVYLELCEIKKYYNIEYSYNSKLNKILITGRKNKKCNNSVFIPITVYEKLNFPKLQTFIDHNLNNKVYIVIVHADSTCVYYQLADGLLEPEDTSAKHLKENKQERLDNELRKHRTVIEEAALLSCPITISKNENKVGCSTTS